MVTTVTNNDQVDHQNESQPKINLATFRTTYCSNLNDGGVCKNAENCLYSHCCTWTRRNPFKKLYCPALCPNLKVWQEGSKLRTKNTCRFRRECPYSHTKEEQMYHPDIYKTKLCRSYPGCMKKFCPFAHGVRELRYPRLNRSFNSPQAHDLSEYQPLISECITAFNEPPVMNVSPIEAVKALAGITKKLLNVLGMDTPGIMFEKENNGVFGFMLPQYIRQLPDGTMAIELLNV